MIPKVPVFDFDKPYAFENLLKDWNTYADKYRRRASQYKPHENLETDGFTSLTYTIESYPDSLLLLHNILKQKTKLNFQQLDNLKIVMENHNFGNLNPIKGTIVQLMTCLLPDRYPRIQWIFDYIDNMNMSAWLTIADQKFTYSLTGAKPPANMDVLIKAISGPLALNAIDRLADPETKVDISRLSLSDVTTPVSKYTKQMLNNMYPVLDFALDDKDPKFNYYPSSNLMTELLPHLETLNQDYFTSDYNRFVFYMGAYLMSLEVIAYKEEPEYQQAIQWCTNFMNTNYPSAISDLIKYQSVGAKLTKDDLYKNLKHVAYVEPSIPLPNEMVFK